jgi:tetratricopeptide (TPR) repeat protein
LVKSNEIEKGLKDLITSMDLLQELLALNPENREWICSLASCQYRVANAFLGTGKTERSLGLVQNSLSLLNQIIETAPDHQDARRFFIEASIILGHIQEVQGRREDAKGTWNRALEMIEEKRSGLREVSLLDRVKWVICMLYLDRIEGAMPEIEQLWESGYREKEFVVLMKKKDVMLQ